VQEETEKLTAEARKLEAERRKLQAETDKMTAATIQAYAQTAKIHRDRWLAPVAAIGAGVGAAIAVGSAVYRLLVG
jgi:Skp family chaperone for outer membrane proteins